MPAPKFDPFDQYYYDDLGYQQPKPFMPHYYSYTRGQAHRCSPLRAPANGSYFRSDMIGQRPGLHKGRVAAALADVLELRRIPVSGSVERRCGSIMLFWDAVIYGCWSDVRDRFELLAIARLMGDDKMPLSRVQSRLLGIRLDVAKRLGFTGFYADYMPFHDDYGYVF